MPNQTPDSEVTAVEPLLNVIGITVTFPGSGKSKRHRVITAVRNVSFQVWPGETLALVGESGSGKSTTARAIMAVEDFSGSVEIDGQEFAALKAREQRLLRRRFQVVLQDPQASLDPRRTVGATIKEALVAAGRVGRNMDSADVGEILRTVGLSPEHASRYPHEMSGGQQQRVNLARAVAMEPDLLVCDEPVSALDVSVQAQIINLLRHLQEDLGLSYLFIAHDLAVVRHMADRVAVMYLGSIVEIGRSEDIYNRPAHPYTAALLSAAPVPNADIERQRERIPLTGEIPKPDQPPSGCHFHPRCPLWRVLGEPTICTTDFPSLEITGDDAEHQSACHFASEVRGGLGHLSRQGD